MIKVCLIGTGAIGSVHLDAYRTMENVSVTIVETDSSKRMTASRLGLRTYETLEDALNESFDLFDICLPTFLHYQALITVLRKTDSKIICEKPLALTSLQAKQIFDISGSKQRLVCAMVEHFNEPCLKIKQWCVKQGGPLEMHFSRRTKKPTNAPWFNKPEQGGDIVLDLGIHDIDLALWFCKARPIRIKNHTHRGNSHESFIIEFSDGSTASIYLGWDLPADHPAGIENTISIANNEELISYESANEQLIYGDHKMMVRPRFPEAYYDEIKSAVDWDESGTWNFPSLLEIVDGLKTVEMITQQRGVNS